MTMSLPDLGRVSEFKAFVLGVHRHVATLQPVEHVESMWLPPLVENAHLLFRHNGRNVGLKGDLRCGERPEMIEFRVTDGVCVPRRRSSRLAICAPVTVTLEERPRARLPDAGHRRGRHDARARSAASTPSRSCRSA